ncbi:MAG: glucosylceramidase [Solirubrobacterales bacterium]|nr:MAG: glucosylceramidase [Solirubrobacterales bacterium]
MAVGILHRVAAAIAALVAVAGLALSAPATAEAPAHARAVRARADAAGLVGGQVEVVQTNASLSEALTPLPAIPFSTAPASGIPIIHVDDGARYQHFGGVGATMTDSSAWLLHHELRPGTSNALMDDRFGSGGIRLSFLRVPMGASDFTVHGRPYTYDDRPRGKSDPRLLHFSVAHDRAYVLPTLRQAHRLNPRLKILANPWSPPAWMKTNHALYNHRDHATLLRSAYGPLAEYFVKFLQAYAHQGVRVAAITPQNEPLQGTGYPGMHFSAPVEARFVARYLRPALQAARFRTKIYGYDYSWGSQLQSYVPALLSSAAGRALAGIAFHCYYGNPTVMSQLHQLDPKLDQVVSECAQGITTWNTPELVISAMRNWASSVALWAVALDPSGGPVQPPNSGCNGCTGMVTISERAHSVSFSRDYFELGQVSRFVQLGAVRIDSEHFVTYPGIDTVTPGLDDVAFLNPDGSKVLVAYNNSAAPASFDVETDGRYFAYTAPANAMTTFVWDRP